MARTNLYLNLSNRLEQYIFKYAAGTHLPSEQELSCMFQVSKPTLRRALAELKRRGLVDSVNGIGNIVSKRPVKISRELIFLCADTAFFMDTLKIFITESTKLNYLGSVVPFCGPPETKERILNTIFERRPAGIVLYTGADDFQINLPDGIPFLHLIRKKDNQAGDLLSFQNAAALVNIVQQFYKRGCRKYALYGHGGINLEAARERELGFREGLNRVRLKFRPELCCTNECSTDFFEQFMERFRDPRQRPDAVCCLNDFCAGDFLRNLSRREIVPEGFLLSGFDHSPVSEFFPVPILTVQPPLEELGYQALKMLVRKIENPGLADTELTLKSKLIQISK